MSENSPIVSQPGYNQGPPPGYHQGGPVTTAPGMYSPAFGTVQGKMVMPLHNGNRAWSSDLFDCMQDATTCIMVLCCAPCVQCQVASRMGEFICVPFFVPGAMIAMRQKLRTVGGIQGTLCNDCLALACCGPCALCQMKREMDIMNI